MREGFEEQMRRFSKTTKGEVSKEDRAPVYRKGRDRKGRETSELARAGVTSGEIDTMEKRIDLATRRAAERLSTDVDSQLLVYAIQEKKQQAMAELKSRLRSIDAPEARTAGEGERAASYVESRRVFRYKDDLGKTQEATRGEVLTDGAWGVEYALDASVPRETRKAYEIERTKRKLRELLDIQILLNERGRHGTPEGMREAFTTMIAERESGATERKEGFIAERMAKNLLAKGVIDDDLPFAVREADALQDVMGKIDFIVQRKERARGVGVEAADLPEDVGIQFTINPNAEGKKREQVAKAKERLGGEDEVDDLMLVVMPMRFVKALVREWKERGRPAGGPDKLFRRENAKELFQNVLGGVLSPEELTASWKKIERKFRSGRND